MTDDLAIRRAEKLTKEGFRHLWDDDPWAALEIAEQLESMGYTSAFELAGLAYARMDDLEAAVTVLERGVEFGPRVWCNWQLLGNYLSDLQRYEAAAHAYDKALECPGTWTDSVRLNQGILASRRGHYDEALALLEQVTDAELQLQAIGTRVSALQELGRTEEALRLAGTTLEETDSDDGEELAGLAARIGRMRWKQSVPAEELRADALAALDRYDLSNRQLLALIRDLHNAYSADAKYFHLLLEAKVPFTNPRYKDFKGYFVSYDVVADTLEEAIAFVEGMEDPAVRGNFVVDECEVLEERPTDPKGVYKRSARTYYA
jgi:tetratricopeptide (TPR) repeat protein